MMLRAKQSGQRERLGLSTVTVLKKNNQRDERGKERSKYKREPTMLQFILKYFKQIRQTAISVKDNKMKWIFLLHHNVY